MKILGIETSCDDTSCAIVENGHTVLANTIASQVDIHTLTGGVVPEVAAREHILNITPTLETCLRDAECNWDDIDAIAVTKGPGLISSLIIGTETASVISYMKDKILIPTQHIIGHIYSNWLESETEPQFPILILTVSGGHNDLILMTGHNEFKILGETRDDAAGEAYDKVARMLGLGYPGGPLISKLAENGQEDAYKLPIVMLEKDSLDFSLSGLKTATLTVIKKYASANDIAEISQLNNNFKRDLAASFQYTINTILTKKIERALTHYPDVKEIHLAGGVSANTNLREKITKMLDKRYVFRYPQKMAYCTDNAAMIAAAGFYLYNKSPKTFKSKTNITPSISFGIQ